MPIYKDKERGTWYFRVYVEDYDGVVKQKSKSGFLTKSMAKDEEKKFIIQYSQKYQTMTFQELYDIFIQHKEQTLKYSSVYALKNRFKNHILPYFKDYLVKKIDNRVYLDWKATIIAKNLSYRYNSELHGCMVAILNYAMDFYDLEKNIASKIGNFSRNNYIRKVDFWTYDEFIKFIGVVDDIVYYVFFTVLYFSGMRFGEILALNWHDIKENSIDVNKTLLRKQINGEYIAGTPKTLTSTREIQIDNQTKECLKNLKDYYKNFVNFSEDWYVFGGIHPLSRTTVSRKKNAYCEKAKVKSIRIHDFRHSHATFLISKNVPITVISKRLGHSNIDITMKIYSHFIPEDEDKAIQLLNIINEKNIPIRKFQENIKEENKKTPINREIVT